MDLKDLFIPDAGWVRPRGPPDRAVAATGRGAATFVPPREVGFCSAGGTQVLAERIVFLQVGGISVCPNR